MKIGMKEDIGVADEMSLALGLHTASARNYVQSAPERTFCSF